MIEKRTECTKVGDSGMTSGIIDSRLRADMIAERGGHVGIETW